EIADHGGLGGKRHQERIFAFWCRGPFDGLARAHRRNPDRRMRALIGPRPQIDVAVAEVIALELEWAGRSPGLDEQIVRLMEALMRECRIDAGRVIFGADAADEAGDQAALR